MRHALLLMLMLGWSTPASAVVNICNKFDHPIHLAVAYPTVEGWVSQGWTNVAPGACVIEEKYAHLTGFYFHAETDPIKTDDGKTTTYLWGGKRAFAVKDGDFQFYRAEMKPKDARFAEFSGPYRFNLASTTVTVTIEPDGTTFTIPKEDGPDKELEESLDDF